MDDKAYLRFENEMRGPEQIIRQRLGLYLPLVEPLQRITEHKPKALDVGSGRGEWLELLMGAGWSALGIDSNYSMVNECLGRGLNVTLVDARVYLSQQDEHSFDLISAFHVVEHLSIDELSEFVRSCFRLLRPGGVLIMETPNPQNLWVGSSEFYIDPTHKRPLPPRLLDYVSRDAGFKRTKLLFLNADQKKYSGPQLEEVIFNTGRDYSLLAQKLVDDKVNEFDIGSEDFVPWANNQSLASRVSSFDQELQKMYAMVNSLQGVVDTLQSFFLSRWMLRFIVVSAKVKNKFMRR